ncbi:MAG: exodeoxyribonuclease VII small subunit [Lautropia sp.]|nr:exodeoxyribonuclease VII small subunit [Lautropia sp.]
MSRSATAGKTAGKNESLPESFEEAMTELESLVEQMETGRLPLEASLAAYKRGSALVRHCRDKLADVTQQVEVLEAGLLAPYRGREGEVLTSGPMGGAGSGERELEDE